MSEAKGLYPQLMVYVEDTEINTIHCSSCSPSSVSTKTVITVILF